MAFVSTYTSNPHFATITGATTVVIPSFAHEWSAHIISGYAYLNGVGPIESAASPIYSQITLSDPITVSGGGASKVFVKWAL